MKFDNSVYVYIDIQAPYFKRFPALGRDSPIVTFDGRGFRSFDALFPISSRCSTPRCYIYISIQPRLYFFFFASFSFILFSAIHVEISSRGIRGKAVAAGWSWVYIIFFFISRAHIAAAMVGWVERKANGGWGGGGENLLIRWCWPMIMTCCSTHRRTTINTAIAFSRFSRVQAYIRTVYTYW
jgi:hypothetical protein